MYSIKEDAVIAIAGTVGVGKSTLTKKLAEHLNFKTAFENVETNPYLKLYYENLERWGFHLQIFFLAERIKQQKKIFEYGGGFIQDRTIYEDLEIFAKMNFDNGTMTENDFSTYKSLFETLVKTPYFQKVDLIVYLEGDVEDILSRINTRGREIEMQTEATYWEQLHKRYQEWIENYTHTPVLRININDYDVENEESIKKIVQKIEKILAVSNI